MFTTTLQMTIILVPSSSSSPKSTGNTTAIAGGAAGGIIALAAAIIIFLLCWRRRRHRDEVAGNFDPNRIMRQAGPSDLEGAVVTPFGYGPPSSVLSGAPHPHPALTVACDNTATVGRFWPVHKGAQAELLRHHRVRNTHLRRAMGCVPLFPLDR
ncbi:hypothetical protein BGY98DRAFT_419293 [Russula aff. rugulosa BPL654]|nr:hypothetical protein BGY98DRAFT_419293 [Russula aff. rugulosa BPL654]